MLRSVLRYRSQSSNYWEALLRRSLGSFPFVLKCRSGARIVVRDKRELWFASMGWRCGNGGQLVIPWGGSQTIRLEGGLEDGDPVSVFWEETYQSLEPMDRSVVDIGASIGDSAIYFALKGASRVIAFEPYPTTWKLACRNVTLNNLQDKVEIINAGVSAVDSTVNIDPRQTLTAGRGLPSKSEGVPVPIYSLNTLVERWNVSDALLKVDCEGAEYGIIRGAKRNVLRLFTRIVMEYHYGIQDLPNLLDSAGFSVTCTRPKRIISRFHEQPCMHLGMLCAVRRDT